MDFIKDMTMFMIERKKYWLYPIIIFLMLIGFLIVIGGSTAAGPFIYTLF